MPQPANIPTLDVCVIDGLPLEKSAYPKDDQNNTRRYRQKERMHAPESITYKNNLPGAKLGHYRKCEEMGDSRDPFSRFGVWAGIGLPG